MTINHFKLINAIAFSLVLTGCAGGITGTGAKSEFACELPQGVNCFSVQSAYQMSLNGLLPGQKTQSGNEELISKKSTDKRDSSSVLHGMWVDSQLKTGISNATVINGEGDSPPEVQFTSPQYIRIWMAPHKNAVGDARDPYYMYAIVEPGTWSVVPPKNQIVDVLNRFGKGTSSLIETKPMLQQKKADEKELQPIKQIINATP